MELEPPELQRAAALLEPPGRMTPAVRLQYDARSHGHWKSLAECFYSANRAVPVIR